MRADFLIMNAQQNQKMNHKLRIFTSMCAMSVFSIHAIAKDASGARSAGSHQLATLPQQARVAGGLTWFEQDAKNADLAITARIRKEITARKNLSVNATNVKIITTGGRVVLKGAVISAEEKHLIGNIAIGVRRRENVDNQLVVGTSPTAPTGLRVVQ